MPADSSSLAKNLAGILGWEQREVEPIVNAITSATSEEQQEELVQGYLGGSKEVRAAISQFLGSQKGLKPSSAQRSDTRGRQQKPGERQAGSVTVKHIKLRRNAADGPSTSQPAAAAIKEVCICLCCGKIHFTRSDTAEAHRFLESGGHCTFCGARVALDSQSTSEIRPPAKMRAAHTSSDAAAVQQESADLNELEEQARAFKDRLVDYDRNARQRTKVVDDQNDFFEIDSNAWLDPEEREQLKRQEREMREAEEARRRRVTVTLDLLGRKVVMADDEEEANPRDAARVEKALAAAEATSAESRQGGGTAASAALRAAARIQPNLSMDVERPMFVATVPETAEERQRRRGVLPSERAGADSEPQAVVGGWEDAPQRKQTMAYERDRLGRVVQSSCNEKESEQAVSNPVSQGPTGTASGMTKKLKRPQLKRLQHDDPFQELDFAALDDVRTEEQRI